MPFTVLALPCLSSDHLAIPCPLPTTASGPAGARDLGETKTTLPLGPPSMGVRDYDGEAEAQQAEWWGGDGELLPGLPQTSTSSISIFLGTVLWPLLSAETYCLG